MLGTPVHLWLVLGTTVVVALVVDLGVFHHEAHKITMKLALPQSAGWIGVAMCFNLWVYRILGSRAGVEFLTGYWVEKSLSVDNIFVFILASSIPWFSVIGSSWLTRAMRNYTRGWMTGDDYAPAVVNAVAQVIDHLKTKFHPEPLEQPDNSWRHTRLTGDAFGG